MEDDHNKEPWELDIRADMWHEMSSQQLGVQQDLIYSKLATLSSMGKSHPTAHSISLALQRALGDLTVLIDAASDIKKIGQK